MSSRVRSSFRPSKLSKALHARNRASNPDGFSPSYPPPEFWSEPHPDTDETEAPEAAALNEAAQRVSAAAPEPVPEPAPEPVAAASAPAPVTSAPDTTVLPAPTAAASEPVHAHVNGANGAHEPGALNATLRGRPSADVYKPAQDPADPFPPPKEPSATSTKRNGTSAAAEAAAAAKAAADVAAANAANAERAAREAEAALAASKAAAAAAVAEQALLAAAAAREQAAEAARESRRAADQAAEQAALVAAAKLVEEATAPAKREATVEWARDEALPTGSPSFPAPTPAPAAPVEIASTLASVRREDLEVRPSAPPQVAVVEPKPAPEPAPAAVAAPEAAPVSRSALHDSLDGDFFAPAEGGSLTPHLADEAPAAEAPAAPREVAGDYAHDHDHDLDHDLDAPPVDPEAEARRARLRKYVGAALGFSLVVTLVAVGSAAFRNKPRATTTPAATPTMVATTAAKPPEPAVTQAPVATATPTADATAAPTASATASAGAEEPSLEAATLDPEKGKALTKDALKLLNQGKRSEAMAAAKAAVAADPSVAEPYLYWGSALMDLGKGPEAREIFSDCVTNATKGQVYECRAMGGKKRTK